MKILVSGASGLIGSAVVRRLKDDGDVVLRLVRHQASDEEQVFWQPVTGHIEAASLEGLDAVVHLAGENIAGRWTAAKIERIRDSRLRGTRLLCDTLARLGQPPKVCVCASAVGYYGDRGAEILDEDRPAGTGFLADLCQAWEAAAGSLKDCGTRLVHLRFGMVLSTAGGALAQMLWPFRLGIGGRLGNGRQYVAWVARDDAVGAIVHALRNALQGPYNVVAPEPVTHREFTKTLGRVLWRPTLLPVPAFALRLLFGRLADEVLLASTRVVPARLQASGYEFRYPRLEQALRHILEQPARA